MHIRNTEIQNNWLGSDYGCMLYIVERDNIPQSRLWPWYNRDTYHTYFQYWGSEQPWFTINIAPAQFNLFNCPVSVHSRTYACRVCVIYVHKYNFRGDVRACLTDVVTSSEHCCRLKISVCLRNKYIVHFLSVYHYFW